MGRQLEFCHSSDAHPHLQHYILFTDEYNLLTMGSAIPVTPIYGLMTIQTVQQKIISNTIFP